METSGALAISAVPPFVYMDAVVPDVNPAIESVALVAAPSFTSTTVSRVPLAAA